MEAWIVKSETAVDGQMMYLESCSTGGGYPIFRWGVDAGKACRVTSELAFEWKSVWNREYGRKKGGKYNATMVSVN